MLDSLILFHLFCGVIFFINLLNFLKMKRIILITCLACFSSFFFSKASINPPSSPINLKGTLPSPPGTVRNPTSPVEAFMENTGVALFFNFDLGGLDIEVVNETGDTVFQRTVKAKAGDMLTISTTGWKSGEYILIITDGQGGCLEGSFIIN